MPPHPFLIALQFLTRLPLRLSRVPTPQENGRSLLWYPAVGLLLGATLWAPAALLDGAPVLLAAALLLGAWVLITGALHLDGLADCADAWIGGHGDRERTLAIMRDPASGPVAVAVVVLVLLLKFTAIAALLETQSGALLLLPPLLARGAMPALFLTTPYVRAGGLGAGMAEQLPRRAATAQTACVLALTIALASDVLAAAGAVLAAVLSFALIRRGLLRRLGGFTGDGAGAVIELVETAVLVTLALA